MTANSTEYIHEVADYKLTVAASLATLVGIFQVSIAFIVNFNNFFLFKIN